MESKLRPKVVLWWGIGLTLAGVLWAIAVPGFGYALLAQPSSATGVDQGLLVVLDFAARIVGQVLTPLGVALIGASVVMAYVGRSAAPRASAPGPALDER